MTSKPWWERSDLRYEGIQLVLAGQPLGELARAATTPLFAYSATRIADNLKRLKQALAGIPNQTRLLYAIKANRFQPLLCHLRSQGLDGIDACSPGELLLARQVGFRESQISFTATSLSDADLDVLARHREVWVNCDSLSAIRRLGKRSPGRTIGLRVNPGVGVGYGNNTLLRYSGEKATKFGIYPESFEEALLLAKENDLSVRGLHFHLGCGYLDSQLSAWEEALSQVRSFADRIEDLEVINVGGGLGIPLVASDIPLDLRKWANILAKSFGDLKAELWVEPGDYLVKDSGVLVLEANTIEQKGGTRFIGVNGGFNLHIEPAFYRLPLEIAPCSLRDGAPESATLAGNINEALDLWGENLSLPPIAEGDFLALLNAGGYGTAMSSNHCLRGTCSEYLVIQEG